MADRFSGTCAQDVRHQDWRVRGYAWARWACSFTFFFAFQALPWEKVFIKSGKRWSKNKDTDIFFVMIPVKITVWASDPNAQIPVQVAIHSDSDTSPPFSTTTGTSNMPFQFHVDSPKLWSPTTPNLYHLTIHCEGDVVKSYLGFRTIERPSDASGIVRPFLNGEFVFDLGPLDQGFWPDGALGTFDFCSFKLFDCSIRTSSLFFTLTQPFFALKLSQASTPLLHTKLCNMISSFSNSLGSICCENTSKWSLICTITRVIN